MCIRDSSWNRTYDANQWDDVWLYAIYGNPGGGQPLSRVATVDNYEVDSSNVAVPWPAGTAPRIDPSRICVLGPQPPEPPPREACPTPFFDPDTWASRRRRPRPRADLPTPPIDGPAEAAYAERLDAAQPVLDTGPKRGPVRRPRRA